MIRKAILAVVACAAIIAVAAPAFAHHSHIAYEPVKLLSFEGVVTEVKWRNPHMWIEIEVPGENGKVETWGFEGSGTASSVASGLSPRILKVGNRVKIVAHPSKNPASHTGLFMGMEVNGKYYARGAGTDLRGTEDAVIK